MKKVGIFTLLAVLTLLTLSGCIKTPARFAASSAVSSSAVSSSVSAVSAVSSEPVSSSAASAVSSAAPAPAAPSQAPASSAPQAGTVTIAIDGTKGGGKTYSFTANFQSNDTVFTVLLRACDGTKNVRYTGSGGTAFVTALYGVANSNTSTDGWVYSVNGVRPTESCGKYTVKNGDKIQWTYSTSPY